MKKILMSRLLFLILGITLAIGITSVFAYSILAPNIGFNPIDTLWQVDNVSDAIDNLYSQMNSKSLIRFCRYVDNEYSHDKTDKLSIGTKYECNPGDDINRYFYIIKVNPYDTIELLMDRNLGGNSDSLTYEQAYNYFYTGDGRNYYNTWKYVLDIKIPSAYVIAKAAHYDGWYNVSAKWFCFDSKSYYNYSPWCGSSPNNSWLFDYLNGCSSFGCKNPGTSGATSYWLQEIVGDNANNAFDVSKEGALNYHGKNYTFGIRPVITVFKNNLYG